MNKLRNTISMVMLVFFFVAVVLGAAYKLIIFLKKVYEKSKRLFEIPSFKQYAICERIQKAMSSPRLILNRARL